MAEQITELAAARCSLRSWVVTIAFFPRSAGVGATSWCPVAFGWMQRRLQQRYVVPGPWGHDYLAIAEVERLRDSHDLSHHHGKRHCVRGPQGPPDRPLGIDPRLLWIQYALSGVLGRAWRR